MMFEGERGVNTKKNQKSYVKRNVWYKTDGQKKHWWTDELAGIKRNSWKI